MTKFKRLMALAAVSMLGVQLIGAGTAFAASTSDCDFGSDNLEITIDNDDVSLWLDVDGMLQCDPGGGDDDSQAVATIDSITVEMDADDSTGELYVYLDDNDGGSQNAAEWPSFDTFDIAVTTPLNIDGSAVDDGAANRLSIKFGKDTFSFSGTSGTYEAPKLYIDGGAEKDSIDASKATVKVDAGGGDEDDTIKGGSGNDFLEGDSCDDGDVIYGNAGNDYVDSGCGSLGQAWGGEGADDLSGAIVAPGAGDDDVNADVLVTYADLTGGIEYVDGDTAGAAGDDDLSGSFGRVYGSQGDDLIVGTLDRILGNAGDDVIKCDGCDGGSAYAAGGAGDDYIAEYGSGYDNLFYGNAGDDVLRGKDGDDELRGGPGSDQAWGATGSADLCTAEVMNRCELIKN